MPVIKASSMLEEFLSGAVWLLGDFVILSLTTVNRVKGILATLRRRRREERHFALVESF